MNEYFKEYAENLGHSLKTIDSILKFTKNTSLIGQYAEKIVVDFLKKSISPIKLCTGSIISPNNYNEAELPQLDIILYEPNPYPPIFQIEEFALVPQFSVFGVLEIKRTDYSAGLSDLNTKRKIASQLLPNFAPDLIPKFLGVICVVEYNNLSGNNELTKLLECEDFTYLIEKKGNNLEINHKGIFDLINFAVNSRNLQKKVGAEFWINPDINNLY